MHLSEIFDSKAIEAGQKKLTKEFNKVIDSVKALGLSEDGQQQILDVLRSEFVNKNTAMVLGAKAGEKLPDVPPAPSSAATDAPE